MLHVLSPRTARGLPNGKAPHSIYYRGCWTCLPLLTMVSLRAECDRDALGIHKVSCMWHTFLVCCMVIHLIFCFPGYYDSADGKFNTAKALVPQCLDSCNVITICKFFQKMWRYIGMCYLHTCTYAYVLS